VINFKWGFAAAIFALFTSVLLGIVSGVSAVHIFLRALVFSLVFFGLGFGLRFLINSFFPELLYISNIEETPSEDAESAGHISIAMDSMGEYAVPELFNQGDTYELGNIDDLVSGVFRPGIAENSLSSSPRQTSSPSIDFSISDGGIDQNKETGYNDSGVVGGVPFGAGADSSPGGFNDTSVFEKTAAEKTPAFQPQFTPSIGDGDDSGLGGLPDLDMMAMAFSSNFSSGGAQNAAAAEPSMPSMPSVPSPGPVPMEEPDAPDRGQYKGNKPQALKGDFEPQALAEGIRTVLSKE